MIIYPAIDLRHGQCAGIRRYNPNAGPAWADNPAATAAHWVQKGAEWLHVINLDGPLGANRGQIQSLYRPSSLRVVRPGQSTPDAEGAAAFNHLPLNLVRLREIRAAVQTPIQFAGGIRTLEDVRLALEVGADRVVLGTVAVENPRLVSEAIDQWGPERILVGMDVRDGYVAAQAWQEAGRIDVVELGHRMHALGVRRVVYKDVQRNGTLAGVNVDATARLGDTTGLEVIASGGVAGLRDIECLKAHEHFNINGVVVGQALYTGMLDLATAVQIGHRPLQRRSAGLVPYRRGPNGPEFLLIFNLFFEQWQFPRGGIEPGESDRESAVREFYEETGLPVARLYDDCRVELQYTATIRNYAIERTVVYFLAEIGGGEIRLGHENHCEARWLPAQEAWELLTETSPEQLPALDAAVAYLSGLRQ
jgi:phosphoribosylformimino-5-aminoimidazole carboxamide ribotide isomerase